MVEAPAISARQISRVLDVARTLALVLDLDDLLPQMARAACDLLECGLASVWLHDADRRTLYTRTRIDGGQIEVPDTSGIVGAALIADGVLNIPRPYDDPRFNPDVDRRTGRRTESLLAAPLVDPAGRSVGVVQAVNKAGGPFTPADEVLVRLLADQAAVAVQRQRLHDTVAHAMVLRRELELAQEVQRALIPVAPPKIPGFTAAGWTRSASIAGGDCYDLWPLPDGRLAVLVADASGHGIGPAMIVSQVRTMARLLCESPDAGCALPTNPADVLRRISHRLEQDLSPGQFVTAVLAFADGSTGGVTFASAGHGPTLLQVRPDATVESLDSNGLPLGVLPDCFDAVDMPPTHTLQLEPGGCLLLMSDGVFEAFDQTGQQFGVGQVSAALARVQHSPDDLLAGIRRSIEEWQGDAVPADDQTLVAIRRDIAAS